MPFKPEDFIPPPSDSTENAKYAQEEVQKMADENMWRKDRRELLKQVQETRTAVDYLLAREKAREVAENALPPASPES